MVLVTGELSTSNDMPPLRAYCVPGLYIYHGTRYRRTEATVTGHVAIVDVLDGVVRVWSTDAHQLALVLPQCKLSMSRQMSKADTDSTVDTNALGNGVSRAESRQESKHGGSEILHGGKSEPRKSELGVTMAAQLRSG